jgi:cytoskeletal protein CcmA (bactofilin family)
MNSQNWKYLKWPLRIIGAILLTALIVLPIVRNASAGEFITGDPDVYIAEDEVIEDDLFVTGRRVEIAGTVEGDLFATGQDVIVSGVVEGTAFLTGQYLTVDGEIDGTLLASGYSLSVDSNAYVSRSTYFAGFGLQVEEGAIIARSLYTTGYQLSFNGEIERDLTVAAGAVQLNGIVGGDATIEVSEIPEDEDARFGFWQVFMPGGLRVLDPGFEEGENAQVAGNIEYSSQEVEMPSVEFPRPAAFLGLAIASWLRQRIGEFLAVIIIGALLLRFLPALMHSARSYAEEHVLPSAGYGCLSLIVFVIGVPVVFGLILLAALLSGLVTLGTLFNTVLGLGTASLGLVIALFTILVTLISKTLIAFLGGRLIFKRFAPDMDQDQYWNEVLFLAVGAFIYALLRSIPLGLGLLVGVFVTLVGLGAVIFTLWNRWAPKMGKAASAKSSAS